MRREGRGLEEGGGERRGGERREEERNTGGEKNIELSGEIAL